MEIKMPIQVPIANYFIHGRKLPELQLAVQEGLLIRDYVNGEISLGEIAKHLNLSYIATRDWLYKKGIATTKELPPDLKIATNQNMKMFIKSLKG